MIDADMHSAGATSELNSRCQAGPSHPPQTIPPHASLTFAALHQVRWLHYSRQQIQQHLLSGRGHAEVAGGLKGRQTRVAHARNAAQQALCKPWAASLELHPWSAGAPLPGAP